MGITGYARVPASLVMVNGAHPTFWFCISLLLKKYGLQGLVSCLHYRKYVTARFSVWRNVHRNTITQDHMLNASEGADNQYLRKDN